MTIAKLLAHFYIPSLDIEMERAVARDWSRLLSDMNPTEIGQAADKWLQTESRRPTIADIRSLVLKCRPKPDMASRQAAVMNWTPPDA